MKFWASICPGPSVKGQDILKPKEGPSKRFPLPAYLTECGQNKIITLILGTYVNLKLSLSLSTWFSSGVNHLRQIELELNGDEFIFE